MTGTVNMAVMGAGGRMGRALIAAIAARDDAVVSGALDQPGAEAIGADVGALIGVDPVGVAVTDQAEIALAGAQVIVDFTVPAASVRHAQWAAETGIAHVIGTTGLGADDRAAIASAAERATIVQSGNMAAGVILLADLVERAAAALDAADWDIEVLEMHHRHKVDAPSGTALLLGDAAASGRGIDLAAHAQTVRDGHTGARQQGTIGFAALRGGSVVGEHSVILAGPGERIALSHMAEDRGIFARGAITAGLWAHSRPPGLYSMRDVLGLDQVDADT